jgi:hypothetical protein
MSKKRARLNVESLESRLVLSHPAGLPALVAAPVPHHPPFLAGPVSHHAEAGPVANPIINPPPPIINPPPVIFPHGLKAAEAWDAIMAKANQLGGQFTGPRLSGLQAVQGGYRVLFKNCDIYDSDYTGAHEVHGAIRDEFNVVQKLLGLPTSDEMDVPGMKGARMNTFQGGAIYWSQSTGAHAVHGAIGAKYNSLGGPAVYGLPISEEQGIPDGQLIPNVQVQYFQGGRAILWAAATGAHAVYGAILAEYAATANYTYANGTNVQTLLGAATSDEMNVPGVPGARMNTFQGGAICWSPATGAHVVYGGVGAVVAALTDSVFPQTIRSVTVQFATGDDDKRDKSYISMTLTDKFGTTVAQSGYQSYGRFADGTTSPALPLNLSSFTSDINTVIPGGQFSLDWEPERNIFLGSNDEWHIDNIHVTFSFVEGGSRTFDIPGRITMTANNTHFSAGL